MRTAHLICGSPAAIEQPDHSVEAMALTHLRQDLLGGVGVVRQRLERRERLAQVFELDSGALIDQPRQPPPGCPLVALVILIGHQQADRQRVG